jgi:serine/threonine protein kinase
MSTMAAGTPPRYRILETIGKGGMGEVRLAHDVVLDRQVAVKFLVSSANDTGDGLSQLLREARAAAALDHPFICKIFEVTELEGHPCIVMEYVPGETLERKLRRGPLPVVHLEVHDPGGRPEGDADPGPGVASEDGEEGPG